MKEIPALMQLGSPTGSLPPPPPPSLLPPDVADPWFTLLLLNRICSYRIEIKEAEWEPSLSLCSRINQNPSMLLVLLSLVVVVVVVGVSLSPSVRQRFVYFSC